MKKTAFSGSVEAMQFLQARGVVVEPVGSTDVWLYFNGKEYTIPTEDATRFAELLDGHPYQDKEGYETAARLVSDFQRVSKKKAYVTKNAVRENFIWTDNSSEGWRSLSWDEDPGVATFYRNMEGSGKLPFEISAPDSGELEYVSEDEDGNATYLDPYTDELYSLVVDYPTKAIVLRRL